MCMRARAKKRVRENGKTDVYIYTYMLARRYVLKMSGTGSRDHLKNVEGADEYVEVGVFELDSGVRTIGRLEESQHPDAKVVINSPIVSRDHARLSEVELVASEAAFWHETPRNS